MSITITESPPTDHPHFSKEAIPHYEELRPHFDSETHAKATTALSAGLEEAREKVTKEIRGLTSSLGDIRKSFGDIRVELAYFGLDKKWSEYSTNFDTLVRTSSQNAANAVAVLNGFAELFPEGETITKDGFDDIKGEMKNLIARITKNKEEAHAIEGGFAALAEDIRLFEVTLEKAVNARSMIVSIELQEAHKNVADLHAKLTQVKSNMTHVGLACVACISGAAISAAYLFLTLSPTAAHALVGSLVALVPTAIEYRNNVVEYKKLRKELKAENKHIAALSNEAKSLNAKLGKTNADMEGLHAKIDSIAGIWHALGADFMFLLGELDNLAGPEINFTRRVNKKVETPRKMYAELSLLLQEYVRGVKNHNDAIAEDAEDAEDE